ncbi:THAP domain-containing protein 1 [Labeo rohita]|uniref:THAP domain-containing protein 1 n=1 Tax=Labeo rohita TaxID=84645 RepID=A0ABQ8N220_LABRO|nr:THAP domain-containing protein 1 [Labeo rohita]
MVRTCKFPGCDHKNVPGSPFRFHRFPVSDIAMRQLWLVAIGYSAGAKISSIKHFRVCRAHFSEDDYIPNQGGKSKKRILKSSAVPVPWCVNTMEQLIGTCALLTLTAARIDGNGKKIVPIKTEAPGTNRDYFLEKLPAARTLTREVTTEWVSVYTL